MVTECRLVAAWGGVWRERQERGITKGHKETLGCDKYVHYLDRVDGFMGVCQNISNCTFKIHTVDFMSIIIQ